MLEINVHITAPELVEAVHDLAKMLAGKPASKFEQSPPQVQDKGPRTTFRNAHGTATTSGAHSGNAAR